MENLVIIQIIFTILGLFFIYSGLRNLLSKKYFFDHFRSNSKPEKYCDLPVWKKIYFRFAWPGSSVAIGMLIIAFVIHSIVKL